MKIIVLKGKEDSGKSSTLNLVYSLLLNRDATLYSNKFEFLKGQKSDFRAILQKNNKKIGIVTQVDYSLKTKGNNTDNALFDHIKWVKDLGCDIAVCAMSTEKADSEEDIRQEGDEITTVINKTVDSDHKMEANIKDAMEILRWIICN